MVVVANAALEARGRPGGLDSPDEASTRQDREGVVHRLERDGADLRADDLQHAVGGNVRFAGDRPQDGQPLRGHLDATLPEKLGGIGDHRGSSLPKILE
jgi:hypothetical protein